MTQQKGKKAARVTPINTEVKSTGVMRLSRGRMFHKRGLWLIEKWKKQNQRKPEERRPQKATRTVEKKVGGEKNGQTRRVRTVRFVCSPSFYFSSPSSNPNKNKFFFLFL
jgi:hypothetical protein